MVDATLVTVHGFWSGPATWDQLSAVWQTDDELEGLRIYGFAYPSPKKRRLPFSWTRVPDFDDIAQMLATEYTTKLSGASSIAFVTHSQGGLILQRFLAWMISEGRARELARIRTITVLACPNGGSEYLASVRRAFGYSRHPQAAGLDVLNKQVAETQRAVLARIVHASGIDDHQCQIPFHVYAAGFDAIVPAASAQAAFPGAGTLAGNHFTILDPSAPGNRTADIVKKHILADLADGPPAYEIGAESAAPAGQGWRGRSLASTPGTLGVYAEPPTVADSDPANENGKAELEAIAAYQGRLARRDGKLEFSLLAETLLPTSYEPLADSFQVSMEPRGGGMGFLVVARRWPRMLLTGLPGMGKSTALRQAAARWAADSAAPIPVLVPLSHIAMRNPRSGADITLAILIQAATAGTPEHERDALRRALESAAYSGEVILLLDGLDECGVRRGVIADGVAEVVSRLPPATGVVLATRDSALPAARKLSLPEAELITPRGLHLTLGHLLRHAAVSAQVPPTGQDRWVRERAAQLDAFRSSHPDLWAVPLLATLLALLVIQRPDGSLPASRASLLREAVQGTVEKWEATRLQGPGRGTVPRKEQLNDGYVEIAHAVTTSAGRCPAGTARQRITVMLADSWGLAPAEAAAAALEIMEFWDDRVGVFVMSQVGDVVPRSRVFAEIGDAIWATRQDTGAQREWVQDSIRDDDRREPAVLAATLSPAIADELVNAAACAADPGQRSRALRWAADSVLEGAEPPDPSLRALISMLAQAAGAAACRVTSDGVPTGSAVLLRPRDWDYAVRLARLPLPCAFRAERDAALIGLELDGCERVLAEALAALADAGTDSLSELGPEQAVSVGRLLARPLPSRDKPAAPAAPPGASKGYRRQFRLVIGYQEAAEQAALYAHQLGPDAASAIYRIAHRGSVSDYYRVNERLTARGYPEPDPFQTSLHMTALVERAGLLWDEWKVFLTAAASIAEPRPLAFTERWRYPHLGALCDVLEARDATLDAIDALSADKAVLPGWIKAAARAAGLALPAISAEASKALEAWQAGNLDVIDIMFAPPSSPPPSFKAARLGEDDLDALIEALGAESEWLSDTACAILSTAGQPAIGQRAADRAARVPIYLRSNAVIVAVANDPSPSAAAARLLDGADPPSRVGAAAAAHMLSGTADDESWRPVLDRARADRDMTVRFAAGTDRATAEKADYWSCPACAEINEAASSQCSSCPNGARLGVQVITVSAQ